MNKYDCKLIDDIDWEKMDGMIPQIVQDKKGVVLTLGYTSPEALAKTLNTGLVHYFSRSRNRIRMKGEISGNIQILKEISLDCDNDALLIRVEQKGMACHKGTYSCFSQKEVETEKTLPDYSLSMLKELEETIESRKKAHDEKSYTAYLFGEGKEKIYKKFGEEAVEVLVAESKEQTIYETADMFYHLLVLLNYNGIKLEEIMAELGRRRK